MTDTSPQPRTLADDLLVGAKAIATFLGCKRSKVYYLASLKRIPIFSLGGSELCARKSKLIEWIDRQEQKSFDF